MSTHREPDAGAGPAEEGEGELKSPSWAGRVPRVRFLELFEKYRRRMVHRETGLPFGPSRGDGAPYTIERLAFDTGRGLRLVLKVFFPSCALLFAFSFLWDTSQHLLRSCSVAGMIGFGTNWVAINMLFWPREPRPIFGHGLIPSQRDQLIEKVANEVLEKLINEDLILEKIEEIRLVPRFSAALIERLREVTREEEFKGDLRNMVLTYVAEVTSNPSFRERLVRKAEEGLEELAGSSFRSWLVRRLREVWRPTLVSAINREIEGLEETLDDGLSRLDTEEVLDRLPQALEARQEQIDRVLTSMLLGLVREVDIRAIVLEQLSTVTSDDLEAGFREFSDDKLSFITLLGGMLGLIGGPVIIWPLQSLAVILVLGVVVTLTDVLIRPLMQSRYYPRRGSEDATPGPEPHPPDAS